MPAAHANPPAISVTPVMKSAVSNRVIVQSPRMVAPQLFDCLPQVGWPQSINEWLRMLLALPGRPLGGKKAKANPRLGGPPGGGRCDGQMEVGWLRVDTPNGRLAIERPMRGLGNHYQDRLSAGAAVTVGLDGLEAIH